MISLVIPIYNEESHLESSLGVILRVIDSLEMSAELILVNDGSADDSAAVMNHARSRDARVKCIHFSRNFGKEAALLAGLQSASGDCVIVMDADLQHPPSLIPDMIKLWKDGYLVVSAVKRSRGQEGVLSKLQAGLFYRAFKSLANLDIDQHSDYKLLDRVVVEALTDLPERVRFFRGLVQWTGFKSICVPFEVAQRADGTSQWGRLKLIQYAARNLSSFTSVPLHFITLLGMLTAGLGAVVGLISIYDKMMGRALDGFTTIILLTALMSGAIMVSIGILGYYMGRIYDEVKGRPPFIIDPTRD